jgi:hypothetical protein
VPYVRHSLLTIDGTKKDAFVSKLTALLDARKGRPGLRAGRVNISNQRPGVDNEGENRMCIMAMFDDKNAADANTGNATSLRESLAEFLIGDGSPLIREGEIIWSFDAEGTADRAIMSGYIRHIAIDFDPSKYDAMLAYADSTINTLKSVSGLRRIRVGLVSDDRKIVSIAWDSDELADAASEKLANAFAGFAEFEYGEPRLVAGDLVYAYTRGS